MKKFFVSLLLLLAMISGLQAASAKVKRKLKSSHHSHHCHTSAQCPKKFTLPRVVLANTAAQTAGSMVYNVIDKKVYISNGMQWIAVEDELPLPTTILVNPALPANGVSIFNTIQEAIDSLGDQNVTNTTIQIAPGVYEENVVLQSILNSHDYNLLLAGDPRDIAGCGINHGSYWNTFNDPSTYLTVGGAPSGLGSAQFVGALSSPTLTVNGIDGCVSPDFGAAGVIAGSDKVLIRHNDGSFFEYQIIGVSGNVLTLSPPLQADANGLGAAMCIEPNVQIAPASGNPITCAAYAILSGLYLNAANGSFAFGVGLQHGSDIGLDNVLTVSDHISVGGLDSEVSGKFSLDMSSLRNFGSTAFALPGANTALRAGTGGYCSMFIENSLFAAGPASVAARAAGLSEYATGDTRFIGAVICNLETRIIPNFGLLDVIVDSGSAIRLFGRGSIIENNTPGLLGIRVRGAAAPAAGPTFGIDLQGGTIKLETSSYSFDSANPTACAIRLGASGVGEPSFAAVKFAPLFSGDPCISTPHSTNAVVQVLNGSSLTVTNCTGPITLGSATNGFQVFNNSSLTWEAGNFTPSAASSGILFNVQRDSSLVIPTASPNRQFSNFATIFNFDDNAIGSLNAITCTTSPNGTNLSATNMARVELGTATFALSGTNVGINTAPNGNVEKKFGTTLTNSAANQISAGSCSQLFTDQIGNYTCTKSTGLIVVSP